eukprot:TRINITY_DN5900_c0_g1_i2.p1 TRINITY_DN5900_c0_g1~~TRINITY_DN5900_c0_g1_i2.p1  ORF type:complete len:522 (-),score=118.39 TRINITY_DN5900_c0_g1_i2:31-1596(-)
MQNQGGGQQGWGSWQPSYAGVGANAHGDAAEAGQSDSGADLSQLFPPNPMANNADAMEGQQGGFGGEQARQDFGGSIERADSDRMDTAGTFGYGGDGKAIDETINALANNPDVMLRLQEDEEDSRLAVRREEDLDDASLALALQLQAEEEERERQRKIRKPLPPLYQGPGADDIDLYVCVDREVQPDAARLPASPAKPSWPPAAPPPSSASSPPVHMSLFPNGQPNPFGMLGATMEDDQIAEDEEEEDDLPAEDDVRLVTANRFSTVAQLMQAIVRSEVFPIRKVSHIRHIAFRALPETPEMKARPFQTASAPVFGNFFSFGAASSGGQEAQQPTPEQSVTSFVTLPSKMKISDLPITEDSVFKVILRKKDRDRKRKRRGGRGGDESMDGYTEDPPTNSLQSPSKSSDNHEEIEVWKQRYMEMHNKFLQAQQKADNLEQDLVLEKLPRLEIPETKKAKAHEDVNAANAPHSVFGSPPPAQPPARPIPKAFALPDFTSMANNASSSSGGGSSSSNPTQQSPK